MVNLEFGTRIKHFIPLSLLRHINTCSLTDLDNIKSSKGDEESEGSAGEGISYLTEADLKAIKNMALLGRGRLSVQSVDQAAFEAIEKLGERGGWEGFIKGKSKSKPKKTKADDTPSDLLKEDDQNSGNEASQTLVESQTSSKSGGKKRELEVDEDTAPKPRPRRRTRANP